MPSLVLATSEFEQRIAPYGAAALGVLFIVWLFVRPRFWGCKALTRLKKGPKQM